MVVADALIAVSSVRSSCVMESSNQAAQPLENPTPVSNLLEMFAIFLIPAGLTYAYTSAAGNNGSAFAGLSANTRWYNITLGIAMFAGRFLMIVPMLAIAGHLSGNRRVPASAGIFPVTTPLFTALLVSVILIVGALTFVPALTLGSVLEHLLMHASRVF